MRLDGFVSPRTRLALSVALLLASSRPAAASAAKVPVGSSSGSALEAAVVPSGYAVAPDETNPGALASLNPAQRLRATFSPHGVELRPEPGERDGWTWGLSLSAWGRPGSLRPAEPAQPSADRHRVTLRRGPITEWFVNAPDGLEQGFSIPAPPEGEGTGLVLDLALSGPLRPVFAADGAAVDFFAALPLGVLRYDRLVVFDATGETVPARFEPIPGGIRIAVDDATAVYPLTVDPVATTAAWTLSGIADGDFLGVSVASAGDVNGDGYSDFLVGASSAGVGGEAYLFLGSASGPSTVPAWTGAGITGGSYGASVASAGDVNGDGHADVVIGSPRAAGSGSLAGRADVYLGSPTGLSATPVWSVLGDRPNAFLGWSVASAGDVNGDGYSDVAIGAMGWGLDALNLPGKAWVYYGSSGGIAPTTPWSATGPSTSSSYGWSVASAGDVDGDGYSDLLVGAPDTTNGNAFLYRGSASGLSTTASWTGTGAAASSDYGASVATAGDVNGDGYADILVGAPNGTTGSAFLYPGSASGPALAPSWTGTGDAASDAFGISVASAGDLNGDGFADVFVGDYLHDAAGAAGANRGRAFAFLGSASGLVATPLATMSGTEDASRFAWAVATAGDVNGDGASDLLIGAQYQNAGGTDRGQATLYYGSTGTPAATPFRTIAGDEDSANLGRSVAAVGDVNGDGYGDIVVGAYAHDGGGGAGANRGRAYLHAGSATGTAAVASWTATGDENGANLGHSVAGAGDVNGDGYADVIVGAPTRDGGLVNSGTAFVYLGSSAGLSATPAWVAQGDEASAQFGYSVGSAGDVNGDGYGDVIVGAIFHDGGVPTSNRGRAYVYLGSANGLSSAPQWVGTGDEDGADFGSAVASAGDVNGDGFDDVAVGAYLHDAGAGIGANRGQVTVHYGSATGIGPLSSVLFGNENSNQFGLSLAGAGDVDGDGYSDLVVGASAHSGGGTQRGQAYVYFGASAGLETSPSWTGSGDETSARFGYSVASAGDVNGDGYSDLIVGAYFHNAGGTDRGRAYLHLGSASGPAATAAITFSGDQNSANLGNAVSSAGDVNGDGFADLLLAAFGHDDAGTNRGRAYVHFGNDGAGATAFRLRQLRADSAIPIAPKGLAFEQRFRISSLLRSPMGRGLAKLEWQAAPLGGSFVPSLNPIASRPYWWNTGVAGLSRSEMVDLSMAEGPWIWRARVRYSPITQPLVPHSPWLTLAENGRREADLRSTVSIPPPPCVLPDEPVWLSSVVESGADWILTFQDPNQPDQRTGWHVRRSNDPVPSPSTWPLVATNVVDMDAGTANIQWTDHSGDDPTPSSVWYYQVTAFNAACPAEGPF